MVGVLSFQRLDSALRGHFRRIPEDGPDGTKGNYTRLQSAWAVERHVKFRSMNCKENVAGKVYMSRIMLKQVCRSSPLSHQHSLLLV